MKRYRIVLAGAAGTQILDLVCRDDAAALLACHDQMTHHRSAEAWDGNQLVCRWERTADAEQGT
jgi:hypothetical protein